MTKTDTMEDSLVTTTIHAGKELTMPLEYVLEAEEDSDEGESSSTRTANNDHEGHHVHFDSHLEMHVISRLTAKEHKLCWYSAKEYKAMLQDAGVVSSSSSSLLAKRTCLDRALRRRRTTAWIQRSLWLGSILMGILVTESLSHPHHHQQHHSNKNSRRER